MANEVGDWDAIFEVTCVRLNLVIYNYHIGQSTIPEQYVQILHIYLVLNYEEALLAGEDMVEVLGAFEGLKDDHGVHFLRCRKQDQLIVLLKSLQHLDEVRPELYVYLTKA